MTEVPPNPADTNLPAPVPQDELIGLLRSLRRKEGGWVAWGKACQTLQKAGYDTQTIFEETGFEPIQQNQVIVASQVYSTIASGGAAEPILEHFNRKGSDVLYELRILTQPERVAVATLAVEKNLDMDEARDVVKAVKDFSRLGTVPAGFTTHPGDMVAYQSWKIARQQSDLQERSRLIAKGLRFAHSTSARKAIEQLLTDFSVTVARPAPRLPVYRLESDDELPRILPVAGKLPLTRDDLQAVPLLEETGAFQLVHFSGTGAWVPVPGWQVIRRAEDPVVLLCDSDCLPTPLPGKPEEVLIVVDRRHRQWDDTLTDSYFVVDQEGQLQLQWFETAPNLPLLGRVILVMRPKKVLDEDYTKELWQIDE